MIVLRWILSVIFIVQMYVAMAVIAVVFAPWALLSPNGARAACKRHCSLGLIRCARRLPHWCPAFKSWRGPDFRN